LNIEFASQFTQYKMAAVKVIKEKPSKYYKSFTKGSDSS
jgi:hypothetical protein